jgi:4-amino-4-deoxy-L-arabinose transferase-like glycosyltransferase
MSADWELFWQSPDNLIFKSPAYDPLRQNYRLLDAPITRLVIGIGRSISSLDPVRNDWDWSKSWAENSASGALPKNELLATSRFSVAIFYPILLFLFFDIGKRLGGNRLAWISLILAASNALFLLHTRRAMAESLVLVFTVLFIWVLVVNPSRKWAMAIPAALALCAKQSTIGLLAMGIVWVMQPIRSGSLKDGTRSAIKYLLLGGLIVFCLNPVGWTKPIGAMQAAFMARTQLNENQVNAFANASPGSVMTTIPERTAGLVGNLFLLPLQFHEIGNYQEQTKDSVQSYLSIPAVNLFRTTGWGFIYFTLALVGIALSLRIPKGENRDLYKWITLAGWVQAGAIMAGLSLPFQRYVIPLVPFTIIWIALAIDVIIDILLEYKKRPVRFRGT